MKELWENIYNKLAQLHEIDCVLFDGVKLPKFPQV